MEKIKGKIFSFFGILWLAGLVFPVYADNNKIISTPQKNSQLIVPPCTTNCSYINPRPYFLLLSLGAVRTNTGKTDNVPLTDAIVNRYTMTNQNQTSVLAGIGFGKHFRLLKKSSVDLGITGYYLNLGSFRGVVHPAYNLAPDFDTLNYKFNARSLALLGELRWFLTCHRFKPYFFLGLGAARNRLSNYRESPSDPNLTASPMLRPFGNNEKTDFAYGLGVGFAQIVKQRPKWSIEYRYLNFGKPELGLTPLQTTRQHLNMGSLSMNSLIFSFYIK